MILPGGNGHAESGVKHQKSIFGNGHDAKEEMVIKYIKISSFQNGDGGLVVKWEIKFSVHDAFLE